MTVAIGTIKAPGRSKSIRRCISFNRAPEKSAQTENDIPKRYPRISAGSDVDFCQVGAMTVAIGTIMAPGRSKSIRRCISFNRAPEKSAQTENDIPKRYPRISAGSDVDFCQVGAMTVAIGTIKAPGRSKSIRRCISFNRAPEKSAQTENDIPKRYPRISAGSDVDSNSVSVAPPERYVDHRFRPERFPDQGKLNLRSPSA